MSGNDEGDQKSETFRRFYPRKRLGTGGLGTGALNATIEQHNSSKVFIRIESIDQVLFDNPTSDSRFVFVGKIKRDFR